MEVDFSGDKPKLTVVVDNEQEQEQGTTNPSQLVQQDLSKSGITAQEMRARLLAGAERAACGIPHHIDGYVIPYYDIRGLPIPFYRCKLFDNPQAKYLQVRNTPNHIYFPRLFRQVYDENLHAERNFVIFTEGEKKALCTQKMGFPCVAAGGVDSWRNKVLLLPKATQFNQYSYNKNLISAKLPSSTEGFTESSSSTAVGFEEFVNLLVANNTTVIIVYDSDRMAGVRPEVQRAAATLGYELRSRGLSLAQIRQVILPTLGDANEKTSLDDFLLSPNGGRVKFEALIKKCLARPTAFPRHPDIRALVTKKLQAVKISRKDMQHLALAIICELDSRGRRMFCPDEGQYYYFDNFTSELMHVDINTNQREMVQGTLFGKMLYADFGISPSADSRLLQWLGTLFSAEEPVEKVYPHRVLARPAPGEDILRIQLNRGQYVKITDAGSIEQGIQLLNNGAEGVLFESDAVLPIDPADFLHELDIQSQPTHPTRNVWEQVFKHVRTKPTEDGVDAHHIRLISLLYYASPWLYRWRGTQLPIELIIGESGTGKSTLCELRLAVLMGEPALRNAPHDLKDWHASIANTGGLHVTDNVQLVDKNLKQRLSDEICRLITEPNPRVEMRKYYTNAELMKIRVDAVFAFTAITQPFMNADLLQRAIILELEKSIPTEGEVITYDAMWKQQQLNVLRGRVGWFVHHCIVLHRFLQAVRKYWNPSYSANHRLINLEQILMILHTHVFGNSQEDASWIPKHLAGSVDSAITDADWAFEGLCTFAKGHPPGKNYSAQFIAEWATIQDDYSECYQLTNSRKLGRYLQTHKHLVATIAGLHENGKVANRIVYKVVKT